jgi:hypothetical protein
MERLRRTVRMKTSLEGSSKLRMLMLTMSDLLQDMDSQCSVVAIAINVSGYCEVA